MIHVNSPQLKTTFSTDSRVQNMFDILLDDEMEKEKREKVSISLHIYILCKYVICM